MPSDPPATPPHGLPAFAQPLIKALARVRDQEHAEPDVLLARAGALLTETWGEAKSVRGSGYGAGYIGLVTEHTHYFPGFAMLLATSSGIAVTLQARPDAATADRVVYSDHTRSGQYTLGEPGLPDAMQIVDCVLDLIRSRVPLDRVDIAVSSTYPLRNADGFFAALAVAVANAGAEAAKLALPSEEIAIMACAAVEEGLRRPFSAVHGLAAVQPNGHHVLLVDAETSESIQLNLPSRERLCWGLVRTPARREASGSFHRNRRDQYLGALSLLQQRGFADLVSFRDLEHHDLERALAQLPVPLVPVVRHLVAENRRVQRLAVALRQENWQTFGALLVMSHASLREAWQTTNEVVDSVVSEAEGIEGIYGARMVGREIGRGVLILGRPAPVLQFLDALPEPFKARFGVRPDTQLL